MCRCSERAGRATFARADALALGLKPATLQSTITRLSKRGRIASPHNGFYLILRPEDQTTGAPDPARWISALMAQIGVDYRVSLLRAAAFHGSSHQAAMVFQVVAPRQFRDIAIGRHRIQFVYQSPQAFERTNAANHLATIKTDAGYANVAGVELTLLDCARYFHKARGLNGVAQIARDIGAKADPRKLVRLAAHYENACVRRLGYLLERTNHPRQAKPLEAFATKAKTAVALDPSVKQLLVSMPQAYERSETWKLILNVHVEVDS